MQHPPSAESESLLARLSARPGVQSTLILSRTTGAIVRSSGLLTDSDSTSTSDSDPVLPTAPSDPVLPTAPSNPAVVVVTKKAGTRHAEEVAHLVWTFVQAAGNMVEGMNGEGDEAKLVRLRTKRNEVVVVVEGGFLLVVVHETAPA